VRPMLWHLSRRSITPPMTRPVRCSSTARPGSGSAAPGRHLSARSAGQDVVAQVEDRLGQATVGVHGVDVVQREWTQEEPVGEPGPHEPGQARSGRPYRQPSAATPPGTSPAGS
jgi:hypothetical protein